MSISKGTLVSWTNKNGVKGSGFALSGEDDGHVIVAVNNFGNETPTGKVAERDDDKHSGYTTWFCSQPTTLQTSLLSRIGWPKSELPPS